MKITKYNIQSLFVLFLFLGLGSCTIDEVINPNNPNLQDLVEDATATELQALAAGVEQLARDEIGFYYDVTSILGRDYYFFTGSDPRYTGELLGKGSATLDAAGFYGTRPYAGRYANVKQCNVLIEAVGNSTASLSDAQRNGYRGFAKTMKAYELHLALNLQYQNGIRTEVSDPDALGPFRSYDEALRDINDLLAEAAEDLAASGEFFAFPISEGFPGGDTIANFIEFNKAFNARIALYRNDKASALSLLDDSFFALNGAFDYGPGRYYSTAGGEEINPVFRNPDQAEAIIAHPDFVASLDPDDDRASKILERPSGELALDDLSGTHDVVVFPSQSSSIPYITNEELILIYAESNIGSNNVEAVAALDVIRLGHGLPAYAGSTDDDSLEDELLEQRRRSLYGQGHRWVDMRRYGRLDELPIDRPDDDVWEQLPRPVSENN
jgi:hypothetical protein